MEGSLGKLTTRAWIVRDTGHEQKESAEGSVADQGIMSSHHKMIEVPNNRKERRLPGSSLLRRRVEARDPTAEMNC